MSRFFVAALLGTMLGTGMSQRQPRAPQAPRGAFQAPRAPSAKPAGPRTSSSPGAPTAPAPKIAWTFTPTTAPLQSLLLDLGPEGLCAAYGITLVPNTGMFKEGTLRAVSPQGHELWNYSLTSDTAIVETCGVLLTGKGLVVVACDHGGSDHPEPTKPGPPVVNYLALDASGAPVWHRTFNASDERNLFEHGLVGPQGDIYVPHKGGYSLVAASTGEVLHTHSNTKALAGPQFGRDGSVYFILGDGRDSCFLVKLDANLKEMWRMHFGDVGEGVQMFVLSDGTVGVMTQVHLVAVDVAGSIKWTFPFDGVGEWGGGKFVKVGDDGMVYVAYGDLDELCLARSRESLAAIVAADGTLRWKRQEQGCLESLDFPSGSPLYVAAVCEWPAMDCNRTARELTPAGRLLWEGPFSGILQASGQKLFVSTASTLSRLGPDLSPQWEFSDGDVVLGLGASVMGDMVYVNTGTALYAMRDAPASRVERVSWV